MSTFTGAAAGPPFDLQDRVYRTLLRLLPRSFRDEAGPEMLAVFRDWRASARPGLASLAQLWGLLLLDLIRCLRAERGAMRSVFPTVDRASMFELLLKETRHALRGLGRAPAFSAIIIATLALGIGANTAIFSVVDGIMLRPLAFDAPDRLVAVWADYTRRDGPLREWLSYPNFHDARQLDEVFAEAGTYLGWGPTLTGVGEPVSLIGAQVSEGMFSRVLAVQPALGRPFAAADDQPDAEAVVLLSWDLWQQQFDGNPGVLGQTVVLDGDPAVIIGIMPERFEPPFAAQARIWMPLQMNETQHAGSRGSAMYRVVARLSPDVALESAQTALDGLGGRLESEFPNANMGVGYSLFDLRDDIVGGSRDTLWMLLGAVGFVLLIACVNVANLLLAQASSRSGELAVRSALGATRGAVVRQLLMESLVLAGAGGTLGAALGILGTYGLVALAPQGTPRIESVATDTRVLVFTAIITVAAALIFGLIPALRASQGNLVNALREAGRSADGSGGRRLRSALVVLQVGLALVLLVGAGLMLRTFQQLNRVDLGFESRGALAVRLGLPGARYAESAQIVAFYDELERRLAAIPGVEAVGGVNSLPLAGFDGDSNFQIDGRPEPGPDQQRVAWIRRITSGYPDAIGLRLISGRFPDAGDDAEAPRVVAINETLAERYFDGQDPIGQRVYFGRIADDPTYRTIVGVVADIKNFGIAQDSRNAIYFPYSQVPTGFMSMVLRANGDPTQLAGPARAVVAELDPLLATANISTVRSMVDRSLAPQRFTATLMGAFAVVALTLAVVGLYGVVSYGVSQRRHEMGVRMALGAGGRDIGQLIVGSSAVLICLGLGLGLVGTWAARRAIAGLLYGVETSDPLTFGSVIGVLLLSGLAAATLPAYRASRIDPKRVLGRD
ncbi:MAG: FtsX-like permease family protein [Acidobacteria bacterium]|nr:FtsX-like permease family protein [Acidobacteriota bacterium]